MPGRDTTTGAVLETMILPSLIRGGYICSKQQHIGSRPSGGKHLVDVIAVRDEQTFIVSLKWQQTSGTAEQKVPFEVICLIDAVKHGNSKYVDNYKHAYLVLGGSGWTLRNFYISELDNYLPHKEWVTILSLEDFVGLANRGKL